MGEGEAGTKGEGLVLELVNQLSAPAAGNALFRPPGAPLALPRWFGGSTSLVDHRHGAIGE